MGLPFLSPEWCVSARTRLEGALPVREGLGFRIQHEVLSPAATPVFWSLEVVDGQVAHWDRDAIADPDLTVRWTLSDALGVLRSSVSGTEAMQRMTVVNDRTPDRYEGPPAPMDLESERGVFPRVPGASVVVQFDLWSAPFGPLAWWVGFEDGEVSGLGFGQNEGAELTIELPYRAYMEVFAGQIGPIDAVAQGRIKGDETGMILYGGLLETPAYQRAQQQCRGGGMTLAALGEVSAQPEWRTALAELAAETEDPR